VPASAGLEAGAPVRVAIPGGIWDRGVPECDRPHRELMLRPVAPEDEVFVLDSHDMVPSTRATALLARCLEGGRETAEALTAGDREAMLLQLRRLSIGEHVPCVLQCPVETCSEPMEFALQIADLLVPAYAAPLGQHELIADEEGARYELTFRLPNGADLDAVAPLARTNAPLAALELLDRCVANARANGVPQSPESLPAGVRARVAAAMAERDPQAEIELELVCPACGQAITTIFDTASFLLRELEQRADERLREVHALASHYHWSEREILTMSTRHRKRYLDLLGHRAVPAA